jgi:hypothetical protein
MRCMQTDLEPLPDPGERIITIPCGPRPPNSKAVIVSETSKKGRHALAAGKRCSKAQHQRLTSKGSARGRHVASQRKVAELRRSLPL